MFLWDVEPEPPVREGRRARRGAEGRGRTLALRGRRRGTAHARPAALDAAHELPRRCARWPRASGRAWSASRLRLASTPKRASRCGGRTCARAGRLRSIAVRDPSTTAWSAMALSSTARTRRPVDARSCPVGEDPAEHGRRHVARRRDGLAPDAARGEVEQVLARALHRNGPIPHGRALHAQGAHVAPLEPCALGDARGNCSRQDTGGCGRSCPRAASSLDGGPLGRTSAASSRMRSRLSRSRAVLAPSCTHGTDIQPRTRRASCTVPGRWASRRPQHRQRAPRHAPFSALCVGAGVDARAVLHDGTEPDGEAELRATMAPSRPSPSSDTMRTSALETT